MGELLARGLVQRDHAWEYFERIAPVLYRYPAIDGPTFRRAVEQALGPRRVTTWNACAERVDAENTRVRIAPDSTRVCGAT